MHSRNTDFILEIQIENYNIHKLISKKSKAILCCHGYKHSECIYDI